LSDPTLAGLYRIGAVVATVDAVNGPHTLDEHIESVRQVALADYILITKLDLVEPAKAKAAEAALSARLRRLNPAAKITRIDDPAFDVGEVLRADALKPGDPKADARAWLNAAAYMEQDAQAHDLHKGLHHDHHHDHGEEDHEHQDLHDHHHLHDRDIASFCFVREQPITREALRLLLDALQQNLGPNLLRVKGIVHVAEEPDRPAVIQGAQHLLHNLDWLPRWPDADRRSKIVFITQGFDRAEIEDMIAVLDRVATRTAAARARAQAQTSG
jgi:G3E family GTPase